MTPLDRLYLDLARRESEKSHDPRTKVGAVIAYGYDVIACGYNCFPDGIANNERWHDKATKNAIVLHAEIMAIHSAKTSVRGCTLYVWPMPPCSRCAGQIINAGIVRVVSPPCTKESWMQSCELTKTMFEEAGIAYEVMQSFRC